MKKLILYFLIGSVFMTLLANEQGYKLPPQEIQDVFDAPRPCYYSFVAYHDLALEVNYERYQSLAQVSDPTVKLAGNEISIKLNAEPGTYQENYLAIHDFITGKKIPLDLPTDIRIRHHKFSYDKSKLAVSYESENGIRLLVADVATGQIKYFEDVLLNDACGDSAFWWLNDNKTLFLKVIPPKRGAMPVRPLVPTAPVIEETSGKVSTNRTYQNLLKDKFDETLFDHFFTSCLATLNISHKKMKIISEPKIWSDIDISPDNQYFLATTIHPPYSYLVPYYRFPQTVQIFTLKGKPVKTILERPLQDQVPIGGVYKCPRRFAWQPLKDASLIWAEALDEGDPKIAVSHRDKIRRLAAPFESEPEELFRTVYRYSGINWSENEDELILSEYDRDRIWIRQWLYQLGSDQQPELLFDMSRQDNYQYPGKPVEKTTVRGERVFLCRDGVMYFDNDLGATPEGRFPFLSQFDLKTKETKILWRCQPEHYETFQAFADQDLHKIAIRSESISQYRNYFFVDLTTGEKTQISDFTNPYPEITDLKVELVNYAREDSIPLSGTLILPADYREGERLPLILEAYPQEFADANTAGQVTESAFQFPNFWGISIRYLVLEGYAVLMNASIPIIGDPETVNETFIEQTVNSVKAAIEYLDERGIVDPQRVGITGHSYGAFMVANVLAHSDICAAGVAKSGAYNRTLTPFGFQSERRTLWEAKDFYMQVSPFMYADQIKEPLLLIHGEDDPNSGTFPLQSKRFFQALKGNGATARLVLLPKEGHGYSARESLLHVLAETIEWFDKYVKNREMNK
ncbi:MAG TPA: prolyl oligopeptidase family serine peptidase [Candidatus Cloacimonadota bacterium]|nr:prolyl oligopeptidase family serine peptidase [Candidatus Cloacimonadota bacterium]